MSTDSVQHENDFSSVADQEHEQELSSTGLGSAEETEIGVCGTLHIPDVISSGTIQRIKRKGTLVNSPQKTADGGNSRRVGANASSETSNTAASSDASQQQSEKKAVQRVNSRDQTVVHLSGSEDDESDPDRDNEAERDSYDDTADPNLPIVSKLAKVNLDSEGRLADDDGASASGQLDMQNGALETSINDVAKELDIDAIEGSDLHGGLTASSDLSAADDNAKQHGTGVGVAEEDDELEAGENWLRKHTRHIFVLSDSGKPIYTRHGREDKLVTEMGLIKALFDFVGDAKRNETLQVLRTDDCLVVYLVRHHLVLVGVSHAGESSAQIAVELSYVFSYIVSQLTIRQIDSIFSKRPNFDLRRLLSDADRCVGKLLERFETDPALLLGAYRTLPLAASLREQVQSIISNNARDPELAFALLLVDAQLVTIVRIRDKKCEGHPQPADVHMLINMIQTNSALRHGEFWAPVCLPSFDAGYFLYCYVHYLDERAEADTSSTSNASSSASTAANMSSTPRICLLLLSVNNDKFFQLSKIQRVIKEKLERQNLLEQLRQAAQRSAYTLDSVGHFGNPELWHFVYRQRSCSQLTSPSIGLPFSSLVRTMIQDAKNASDTQQTGSGQPGPATSGPGFIHDDDAAARYVLARYSRVHKYLHSQVRPFRSYIQRMHRETVCGCLTSDYELYAIFSPYTPLPIIVQTIQRVAKWVKQEESRLFALQTWPVFAQ